MAGRSRRLGKRRRLWLRVEILPRACRLRAAGRVQAVAILDVPRLVRHDFRRRRRAQRAIGRCRLTLAQGPVLGQPGHFAGECPKGGKGGD